MLYNITVYNNNTFLYYNITTYNINTLLRLNITIYNINTFFCITISLYTISQHILALHHHKHAQRSTSSAGTVSGIYFLNLVRHTIDIQTVRDMLLNFREAKCSDLNECLGEIIVPQGIEMNTIRDLGDRKRYGYSTAYESHTHYPL